MSASHRGGLRWRWSAGPQVGAGKSYTGLEFDALSEAERNEAVQSMALFSRVEPSHKSKLVKLLKAQNQVRDRSALRPSQSGSGGCLVRVDESAGCGSEFCLLSRWSSFRRWACRKRSSLDVATMRAPQWCLSLRRRVACACWGGGVGARSRWPSGGGHDGRRRERRARAQACRHRRCHGVGHGGGQGRL